MEPSTSFEALIRQARAIEAERQNAHLRAALDRAMHSNSWRLTRPLRNLRDRERRGWRRG